MNLLTEAHWSGFRTPKGTFNGTQFEELVRDLLPHLWPGTWHRTQQSWDGKRDFETVAEGQIRWAECKMYQKNISINVLSPTLVMALIEQASVILFFSYSRINENALRYLAQFSMITDKAVGIYDDEVLETAILAASPVLTKYFPGISPGASTPRGVTAWTYMTQDVDLDYAVEDDVRGEVAPAVFTTLSPFAIDVFVRNDSATRPISGRIRLEWPRDTALTVLEGAPAEHGIDLPPSSLVFRRFYVMPHAPGANQAPPSLVIETGGRVTRIDSLPSFNVSSLLEAPLIGATVTRHRDDFDRLISARSCSVFAQVYGGSGTGKTRLLREFRDRLLAYGFAVHRFNGEDRGAATFDAFVRRLLSRTYKLPLTPDLTDEFHESRRGLGTKPDQIIIDILYSDTFRPSDHREVCIQAIARAVQATRTAVIIDNVQNFDDATIDALVQLFALNGDPTRRDAWILGVNTEFLTSTAPVTRLHHHILDVSTSAPDGTVRSFGVRGFSEEDGKLYLRHVLGIGESIKIGFTDVEPDLAEYILAKTELNPLFLEQALLHAETEGGLERRGGRLYVAHIPTFRKTMEELPPSVRQLIARRWTILRTRLPLGAEAAVRALSVVGGAHPLLFDAMGIAADAVDELVRTGMLIRSETNEVRFYHNQHALFFEGEYGASIGVHFARQCLAALKTLRTGGDYFYATFLLRDVAGEMDAYEITTAAERIAAERDFTRIRVRAGAVLFRLLNAAALPIDANIELRALRAICEDLERQVAYGTAIDWYRVAYEARRRQLERYLGVGDAFYAFVYAFVDAQFAVSADEQARPTIEEAIREADRFTFTSQAARNRAVGWLLNRLSVADKTRGDAARAEADLRRSLELAAQIDDAALTFADYVDWGNIFFGTRANNPIVIEKWSAAFDTFTAARGRNDEIDAHAPSALLHHAYVALLRGDIGASTPIIADGLIESQRWLNAFYEIKLLLLSGVSLLLQQAPRSSLQDARKDVEKAISRCVTWGALRPYWIAFYTRAKLELAVGEGRHAYESFTAAAEQMFRLGRSISVRHRAFLDDFALTCAQHGWAFPHHLVGKIPIPSLQERVLQLATLHGADLDAFLSSYVPISSLTDGRSNLPLP